MIGDFLQKEIAEFLQSFAEFETTHLNSFQSLSIHQLKIKPAFLSWLTTYLHCPLTLIQGSIQEFSLNKPLNKLLAPSSTELTIKDFHIRAKLQTAFNIDYTLKRRADLLQHLTEEMLSSKKESSWSFFRVIKDYFVSSIQLKLINFTLEIETVFSPIRTISLRLSLKTARFFKESKPDQQNFIQGDLEGMSLSYQSPDQAELYLISPTALSYRRVKTHSLASQKQLALRKFDCEFTHISMGNLYSFYSLMNWHNSHHQLPISLWPQSSFSPLDPLKRFQVYCRSFARKLQDTNLPFALQRRRQYISRYKAYLEDQKTNLGDLERDMHLSTILAFRRIAILQVNKSKPPAEEGKLSWLRSWFGKYQENQSELIAELQTNIDQYVEQVSSTLNVRLEEVVLRLSIAGKQEDEPFLKVCATHCAFKKVRNPSGKQINRFECMKFKVQYEEVLGHFHRYQYLLSEESLAADDQFNEFTPFLTISSESLDSVCRIEPFRLCLNHEIVRKLTNFKMPQTHCSYPMWRAYSADRFIEDALLRMPKLTEEVNLPQKKEFNLQTTFSVLIADTMTQRAAVELLFRVKKVFWNHSLENNKIELKDISLKGGFLHWDSGDISLNNHLFSEPTTKLFIEPFSLFLQKRKEVLHVVVSPLVFLLDDWSHALQLVKFGFMFAPVNEVKGLKEKPKRKQSIGEQFMDACENINEYKATIEFSEMLKARKDKTDFKASISFHGVRLKTQFLSIFLTPVHSVDCIFQGESRSVVLHSPSNLSFRIYNPKGFLQNLSKLNECLVRQRVKRGQSSKIKKEQLLSFQVKNLKMEVDLLRASSMRPFLSLRMEGTELYRLKLREKTLFKSNISVLYSCGQEWNALVEPVTALFESEQGYNMLQQELNLLEVVVNIKPSTIRFLAVCIEEYYSTTEINITVKNNTCHPMHFGDSLCRPGQSITTNSLNCACTVLGVAYNVVLSRRMAPKKINVGLNHMVIRQKQPNCYSFDSDLILKNHQPNAYWLEMSEQEQILQKPKISSVILIKPHQEIYLLATEEQRYLQISSPNCVFSKVSLQRSIEKKEVILTQFEEKEVLQRQYLLLRCAIEVEEGLSYRLGLFSPVYLINRLPWTLSFRFDSFDAEGVPDLQHPRKLVRNRSMQMQAMEQLESLKAVHLKDILPTEAKTLQIGIKEYWQHLNLPALLEKAEGGKIELLVSLANAKRHIQCILKIKRTVHSLKLTLTSQYVFVNLSHLDMSFKIMENKYTYPKINLSSLASERSESESFIGLGDAKIKQIKIMQELFKDFQDCLDVFSGELLGDPIRWLLYESGASVDDNFAASDTGSGSEGHEFEKGRLHKIRLDSKSHHFYYGPREMQVFAKSIKTAFFQLIIFKPTLEVINQSESTFFVKGFGQKPIRVEKDCNLHIATTKAGVFLQASQNQKEIGLRDWMRIHFDVLGTMHYRKFVSNQKKHKIQKSSKIFFRLVLTNCVSGHKLLIEDAKYAPITFINHSARILLIKDQNQDFFEEMQPQECVQFSPIDPYRQPRFVLFAAQNYEYVLVSEFTVEANTTALSCERGLWVNTVRYKGHSIVLFCSDSHSPHNFQLEPTREFIFRLSALTVAILTSNNNELASLQLKGFLFQAEIRDSKQHYFSKIQSFQGYDYFAMEPALFLFRNQKGTTAWLQMRATQSVHSKTIMFEEVSVELADMSISLSGELLFYIIKTFKEEYDTLPGLSEYFMKTGSSNLNICNALFILESFTFNRTSLTLKITKLAKLSLLESMLSSKVYKWLLIALDWLDYTPVLRLPQLSLACSETSLLRLIDSFQFGKHLVKIKEEFKQKLFSPFVRTLLVALQQDERRFRDRLVSNYHLVKGLSLLFLMGIHGICKKQIEQRGIDRHYSRIDNQLKNGVQFSKKTKSISMKGLEGIDRLQRYTKAHELLPYNEEQARIKYALDSHIGNKIQRCIEMVVRVKLGYLIGLSKEWIIIDGYPKGEFSVIQAEQFLKISLRDRNLTIFVRNEEEVSKILIENCDLQDREVQSIKLYVEEHKLACMPD